MTAARRLTHSFALEHAAHLARSLNRPLLIFEPLGCRDQWASDRFHAFVVAGMADNAAALAGSSVGYYPFVERSPGQSTGLLTALASSACVVVTDDYPAYFLPKIVAKAAATLAVQLVVVDGNGLIPMRAPGQAFAMAQYFRRWIHKFGAPHLAVRPAADPLVGLPSPAPEIPATVLERWPSAVDIIVSRDFSRLPIDHEVGPVASRPGGSAEGARRLRRFVAHRLGQYDERNHPDVASASGLSPWLHFGHVGAHAVFDAVVQAEGWSLTSLAAKPTGKREGWWGMSSNAEGFLDELVTWREIGFVEAVFNPNFDTYAGLPDWARRSLAEHASDARDIVSFARLERAQSPDVLWNAAQRELRREGIVQNYLRMLWGKNVLAWTESPEVCFESLVRLNNRWALDGRDPNSYTGIAWVLGRHDRAWGPERPIFGKVRYMTSDQTKKKLQLKGWLARFGDAR